MLTGGQSGEKRRLITMAYDTSYCFYGAGERTRTSDLLITNQLLYRLSYTGMT